MSKHPPFESLAVELAKRTHCLRNVIHQQYRREQQAPGMLSGFFEAFQTYLIGSLTPEDFSDLLAQTITYGLFAARIRTGNGFNRRMAFDNALHSIGVLRDLFRYISLGELSEPLAWCVDDIAEVLAMTDISGILDRHYHNRTDNDPSVHFYETFLAQYDPSERQRRGVYYTPEAVVQYIVRSLHGLLKTAFDQRDGFASDQVILLDPAAGTMTFVAHAAQQAVAEFESRYGSSGTKDFIRRHILKNFYALERMLAPYAVGHLMMNLLLEELGHRPGNDERVRFYLTNTLEQEELDHSQLPGLSVLADESHLAGAIKKCTPIPIILGNPPYSGHSSNCGSWIRGLIESYKQVDGKPLGEKNAKWLQDDYVKFLRFAQWKIEQAGHGVVGMITNHSYLDNPTFRGMRRSLMRTFEDIYILDLHGNSLKKETAPDGGLDQNVFDIRQGVAIAFFVKRGRPEPPPASVHHAERYGTRESKYAWLTAHDHERTEWKEVRPVAPFYLFVPRDNALEAEYRRFIPVTEIFPVHSVGIVTARDRLTVRWSAQEVWNTVVNFSRMEPELAREGYQLGTDTRDWKVLMAQQDLLDSGPADNNVIPILYRPFDVRYTYYTGRDRGFLCRPRTEVMRHMLVGENLALCVGRQGHVVGAGEWNLVCCSQKIADLNLFCRGGNVNFPLYLYPSADRRDRLAGHDRTEREPNLNPEWVAALAKAHGDAPSPEAIFGYIYAMLYAPAYRQRYADFLRIDFPRIPLTTDRALFAELATLGERLVALHLLLSAELDPPICRFEGEGDGVVAVTKTKGFRYQSDEQRFYINRTQYFGPVSRSVYKYRIGGYPIGAKWLKDRRQRWLNLNDIRTYCHMVTAIEHTLTIQQQIEHCYFDATNSAQKHKNWVITR